jgi:hypothetical protein
MLCCDTVGTSHWNMLHPSALWSSEMLVRICRTTRGHRPDHYVYVQSCESVCFLFSAHALLYQTPGTLSKCFGSKFFIHQLMHKWIVFKTMHLCISW